MMELQKELILPCGAVLQNRVAKSAMSENLSPKHHGPTKSIVRAYEAWAKGGTGLIITGNVMIASNAIGEPGNVVVENENDLDLLKEWAATIKNTNSHLWVQLNHPGRQALGYINKEVVAPSPIKTKIKGMGGIFKVPRKLTDTEIKEIIERFGNSALILKKAGFTGVQIHGAHGYLVSQFLSPLVNQRTDAWGGSAEKRMKFVLEVYKNIRKKVGKEFPIGIKINSADFQRGGFTEEESIGVIKKLDEIGIDLIEVSGGTYEQPSMTGYQSKKSTLEREAYFMEYVEKARTMIKTPLMLTGGFRTVSIMEDAIAQNKVDIVGLARPFSIYPQLTNQIFEKKIDLIKIPPFKTGIKFLDTNGFVEIKWHEQQIHRLGKGKDPKPKLSPYSVLIGNILETVRYKIFGS